MNTIEVGVFSSLHSKTPFQITRHIEKADKSFRWFGISSFLFTLHIMEINVRASQSAQEIFLSKITEFLAGEQDSHLHFIHWDILAFAAFRNEFLLFILQFSGMESNFFFKHDMEPSGRGKDQLSED